MRYRVLAPLVLVLDGEGRRVHAYRGAVVELVDEDQRAHLLGSGMVVPITEAAVIEIATERQRQDEVAEAAETERVRELAATLDAFEIPLDAGRPTARAQLFAQGVRVSNETLAAALNFRRERGRPDGFPAAPQVVTG